jgi:hypothetical protein
VETTQGQATDAVAVLAPALLQESNTTHAAQPNAAEQMITKRLAQPVFWLPGDMNVPEKAGRQWRQHMDKLGLPLQVSQPV